jgi:hypothetical protein
MCASPVKNSKMLIRTPDNKKGAEYKTVLYGPNITGRVRAFDFLSPSISLRLVTILTTIKYRNIATEINITASEILLMTAPPNNTPMADIAPIVK